MPRILLIDRDRTFAKAVTEKIESELNYSVEWKSSASESASLLKNHGKDFLAVIIDYDLPKRSEDRLFDLAKENGLPVLAVTARYSEELRCELWERGVADYVLREGSHNIEYLAFMVRRLHRNPGMPVMIVDDSLLARTFIRNLLVIHRYTVHEAANGEEALALLDRNPNVKLMISDYSMPGLDGFALAETIRQRYTKEELAIIGVSGEEDPNLSARFIKSGANDFLRKPFSTEEFYCRVTQNIETIESIKAIKEFCYRDYLTYLYNRRYFFESASKIFESAKRAPLNLALAMVDIDDFKKINDTWGHEAGDKALRHVAMLLEGRFRGSDIVCRFGGEEFCILAANMDRESGRQVFEETCRAIADTPLKVEGECIPLTISIGVCFRLMPTLEQMIKQADTMLYAAKREGKNRVRVIV